MVEEFLGLPLRPSKPRERGLTHVIDKGMTLAEVNGLFETAGEYVDIVKLGWGTSYVTQNLSDKVKLYRSFDTPVMCGGTLQMERESKQELIGALAEDFVVLSEVGSKDQDAIYAPYQWVAWIREELEAGAWKVITEARETGTAGIFRGTGEVRSGLIDEIVHEIPLDQLLFEAPQKEQQAWFIRHLGPEVNLGNIPPDEVIPLETLRLGLRSDTMPHLLLRDIPTAT